MVSIYLYVTAIFCRYCGIRDPSWSEIRHFVQFLNVQLHSCERSYFTNTDLVGDILSGFKSFVIKFMIRMSTVSYSSLYNVSLL